MKVTWTTAEGTQITADVPPGTNMMEAALAHDVAGVVGECGGNLACATCHVYVAEAWAERAGSPDDFEDGMLDVTDAERQPTSRLSCQIIASEDLDGLELIVPAE